MVRNAVIFSFIIFILLSCKDQVKEYSGFTQKELEYLLASTEIKVWERVSREEDGAEVIPDDCGMDNFLIFFQGDVGKPKDLLYAYNPNICDSLDFCNLHPDFCNSNVTNCAANPVLCDDLQEGLLYIGTWYAKAPFIVNSRSDTLVFTINGKTESIHVTDISSEYATFVYKNRQSTTGGTIEETYKYLSPIPE
jgi:hypothetical protein